MESKLQSRIIRDLEKDKTVYVVKIKLCNRNGFPDLMCLRRGRAIFMEVKDKGKKSKALQILRHGELAERGCPTYVVDSWKSYLAVKFLLYETT